MFYQAVNMKKNPALYDTYLFTPYMICKSVFHTYPDFSKFIIKLWIFYHDRTAEYSVVLQILFFKFSNI